MKKIYLLFLALICCFSIYGCSSSSDSNDSKTESTEKTENVNPEKSEDLPADASDDSSIVTLDIDYSSYMGKWYIYSGKSLTPSGEIIFSANDETSINISVAEYDGEIELDKLTTLNFVSEHTAVGDGLTYNNNPVKCQFSFKLIDNNNEDYCEINVVDENTMDKVTNSLLLYRTPSRNIEDRTIVIPDDEKSGILPSYEQETLPEEPKTPLPEKENKTLPKTDTTPSNEIKPTPKENKIPSEENKKSTPKTFTRPKMPEIPNIPSSSKTSKK